MIAFWLLAPIMVAAAIGMVVVRKAVHSALMLAVVMVSLAILYLLQDAPFLAAVQVIVYTGAVLMLFLFVVMLVGVDADDSLVETLKGQRLLATFVGFGFGFLLVLATGQAVVGAPLGLRAANGQGNVEGLAAILFSDYVFAFEVTGALLVTAALAAMVLAHRERLSPKPSQRQLAEQRMRDYSDSGRPLGPLPPPGVYARHNAVDTPALLPDGSTSDLSVSRVLKARGTMRSAPEFAEDTDETVHAIGGVSAERRTEEDESWR